MSLKERLTAERWAYILAMLGAAVTMFVILRWSNAPTALEFKDITGDLIQDLFLSLLLITTFKERAQEIYVIAWRKEGRSKCEAAVKDASTPAEQANAERDLSIYRAVTGRYVSLISLCSGLFISLAGVRVLAPLVEPPTGSAQQSWLFIVDVLLTGGLLAGGSKLIHEIMAVVSEALDRTRGKLEAPPDTPTPEDPVAIGGAEATGAAATGAAATGGSKPSGTQSGAALGGGAS